MDYTTPETFRRLQELDRTNELYLFVKNLKLLKDTAKQKYDLVSEIPDNGKAEHKYGLLHSDICMLYDITVHIALYHVDALGTSSLLGPALGRIQELFRLPWLEVSSSKLQFMADEDAYPKEVTSNTLNAIVVLKDICRKTAKLQSDMGNSAWGDDFQWLYDKHRLVFKLD